MASTSLIDTLFQRTLDDIIKGLRHQQTGESAFISKIVEEIRREIKSTDLHTKSVALQKLTYLNSLHFIDMSWAAFHAVECISSPNFSHKKLGYLAISQSFHESTPVMLLITNQLRKDLKSSNEFEVSLALECLSTIGTVDLCRDLIFAKLAPLEPRLAKRVVEPICDHMRRTEAKSLIFESIRTVVTSFTGYESAVKLAVSRIREFLVDDDQNLKYLGLHALAIIAPKHLWAVLENKEVVIESLSDADPNVKGESLRLVMAMVSESNVVEICRVLINYALKSDPEFCNEILASILSKCSQNVYEVIVDFDWYASLLGEMSRIPHCQKSEEIENQLIDIGMRVRDVRLELVRIGRDLLIDPALLGNSFLHRILSAAAWVCGEYVEFSRNPIELMEALLQPRTSLLPPSIRTVYMQSAFKILVFCLHSYFLYKENNTADMISEVRDFTSHRESPGSSDLAANKPPAYYEQDEGFNPRDSNKSYEDLSIMDTGDDRTSNLLEKGFTHESIIKLLNLIELAFGPLSGSCDVEVQELARNVLGFLELIKQEICDCFSSKDIGFKGDMKASKVVDLVHDAFSEDLGPVSVNAQERVPIPDGLVLKENLADLEEICGNVQLPLSNSFSLGSPYGESIGASESIPPSKEELEPSSESSSLLAEHRKRHGLYYLPSEKNEITTNDYPPANDPKSCISTNDDAQDLVKLADQSLISKRKPNYAKPRPVVVKLDEGDVAPINAKKPEIKDDLLSDAVREVLLGNTTIPALSQGNSSDKLSSKRKGKEKQNVDLPESRENLGGEKPDLGNSSSRKSKHRSQGKERSKKSTEKNNTDEREDHEEKGKQKSKHRHGRHKTQQRAETRLNLVAQTPVIPDFLL
eukprot:XP_015578262.1 AP-3 complex subunit delta [Ricinus communis]